MHSNIQQKLDGYMKTCDGDQNERDEVRKYLDLSYGRVLRNSLASNSDDLAPFREESVFQSAVRETLTQEAERQNVHHIIDWLVASVRSNEAWLKNVDDLGRPKKLLKFSTLQDIVKEADKAMMKANQKLLGVRLAEGDESLEMELEEGCYIVRLLTPAALDRESGFMQHCIGNGSYDKRLEDDNYRYWSLRDRFGKPHATIEARRDKETSNLKAFQISGKQNKFPIEKYALMLGPFFAEHEVDISRYENSYNLKILGKDGTFHDKRNLPSGFVTVGDLNIEAGANYTVDGGKKDTVTLPKGLHVRGTLTISNADLQNQPINVRIDGSLKISRSDNVHIANAIHVGKDLSIAQANSVYIEDEVVIGGDLMLAGITGMEALPNTMKIGGKLSLKTTPIEVIPSGIEFNESLHVSNTPITKLPANRIAYKSLRISGTKITEFPEKLEISHEMSIESMKTDQIKGPREIVQTGEKIDVRYVSAKIDTVPVLPNLQIVDCEIQAFPEDFVIDGDIAILNCQIKKMPTRLAADFVTLIGDLPNMPAELTARKLLSLTCTPWDGLPDGTKYDVQGLHLEGITVKSLHPDIKDDTKIIIFTEDKRDTRTTAAELRRRIQEERPDHLK